VRPLLADGAKSAAAATRDYVLKWQGDGSRGPMLNIFGGKITTHRKLAEKAVDMVSEHFQGLSTTWTEVAHLPGGDFPWNGAPALAKKLADEYPFLGADRAKRFIRLYGTRAFDLMEGLTSQSDMGQVNWQIANEFVLTADDVIWRRTKLGIRMSKDEVTALGNWFKTKNLTQDQD